MGKKVPLLVDESSLARLEGVLVALSHLRTGGGITASMRPGQSLTLSGPGTRRPSIGSIQVQRVQVQSEEDDYLVVRAMDQEDTVDDADLILAKPFTLRKTPYDGKTVNDVQYTYSSSSVRQCTAGGFTWTERLTPPYAQEDELLAIIGFGGTPGLDDVDDQPVNWLDLNVDGRRWVPDPLVRFGKAKGAWDDSNTVAMDPCDGAGVDNGDADVDCYIIMPADGKPAHAAISKDDVFPFVMVDDTHGLLLGVRQIPDGEEYQVLQLDGDGVLVADWVRMHG